VAVVEAADAGRTSATRRMLPAGAEAAAPRRVTAAALKVVMQVMNRLQAVKRATGSRASGGRAPRGWSRQRWKVRRRWTQYSYINVC
jgi:hypothetical protein